MTALTRTDTPIPVAQNGIEADFTYSREVRRWSGRRGRLPVYYEQRLRSMSPCNI